MPRYAPSFSFGAKMVWLFYTPKRIVEVRTAATHLLLTEHDMLDGGEALPGFSMLVARCFRRLK